MGLQMRHDSHYVEELAGNRPVSIGRLISPDLLDPNPDQPRVELGDLQELIASIKEKGVLEPLLVKPSKATGRWMIIAGERRWHASKAAGLRELPCIEMDVDDRAVAEIALIENMQRKDLTAWEEADGLALLCEKFGYTHDDVAKKLGKSRTTVTEALSIAALPEEIREECRRADITAKTTLLEIVRQPDDLAMRQVLSEMLKKKLNRQELREARRAKREEGEGMKRRREPFVFSSNSHEDSFRVEVLFQDGVVSEGRVRGALLAALSSLPENEG
ncbi:MAG: ParB/RepB/Spo0J family partition protein [Acidobacteria bacterium]|nr:ParB/RepB/Spo0J family partition protein [Acidobacteriota bacterium]